MKNTCLKSRLDIFHGYQRIFVQKIKVIKSFLRIEHGGLGVRRGALFKEL